MSSGSRDQKDRMYGYLRRSNSISEHSNSRSMSRWMDKNSN